MTEDRFVIVGASIGGMTAAEEVRKRSAAEIVLIDGDREVPYDKTVLSKGELIHPASAGVGIRTPEQFAEQNIDLRTACLGGKRRPGLKGGALERRLTTELLETVDRYRCYSGGARTQPPNRGLQHP